MRHVEDRIDAFVAGELAGPEHRTVADHLNTCPTCRARAEEARRVWDQLGALAVPPSQLRESAWPGIQARVFGTGRASDIAGPPRWARAGLAVLAVTAGMSLAALLPGNQGDGAASAVTGETSWGSAFWLDEVSDTTFSDYWLAAADEGNEG